VNLKESLLSEFDHEMAATRQLLASVPEDAFAWRPHERSFSMGGLVTHLAVLPRWGTSILDHDHYELSENGPRPSHATRAEVLAAFDTNLADVRRRLVDQSDGQLAAPWTIRRKGHVLLSLPKAAAFRRFLLQHLVHHRGQLTVYLRMHDVPLPPLYGPSADEPM
jgi:uncharacterized damage-inducible protein DinB